MPLSALQHCYHRTPDRHHLPPATMGTALSADYNQIFRSGVSPDTRLPSNPRHRQDKADLQAMEAERVVRCYSESRWILPCHPEGF